jgi:hypothetical protein
MPVGDGGGEVSHPLAAEEEAAAVVRRVVSCVGGGERRVREHREVVAWWVSGSGWCLGGRGRGRGVRVRSRRAEDAGFPAAAGPTGVVPVHGGGELRRGISR